MNLITCPRCDARWTGLKIEHCSVCHATFTSTRAGDRHLVDADPTTGRSRHLTAEEMDQLRRRNGEFWYTVRRNPHGTLLWSQYNPKTRYVPRARRRDSLAAVTAAQPRAPHGEAAEREPATGVTA